MSKLADGRLGRCHRFRDLCRGKDVMGTAALDPSYGFRGPKMRRAARSAALPDPSRVSGVQRIRLVGIDLVKLDRPAHILRRHLPFRRQRRDRGLGDVVAVDRSEENTSELQSLMRISY